MPTCLNTIVRSHPVRAHWPKRPLGPRPTHRRKQPRPVTLIIGIICKDGLVMACDTQVTTGQSKRINGTKLREIQLADMPLLVAQAGSYSHTGRYIQILAQLGEFVSPKSAQDVATLMQRAMEEFKKELSRLHLDCTSEELVSLLSKLEIDCNILCGFYLDGKSHLISINICDSIPRICETHFEADGTGALLGDFLLSEQTTPGMPIHFASTMAVYVVGVVKRYDLYCSGNTVVAMILPGGGVGARKMRSRAKFLSSATVQEYSNWVVKAEAKTREQRNSIIGREFSRQNERMLREIDKMIADLPPLTEEDVREMSGDHPNYPSDPGSDD